MYFSVLFFSQWMSCQFKKNLCCHLLMNHMRIQPSCLQHITVWMNNLNIKKPSKILLLKHKKISHTALCHYQYQWFLSTHLLCQCLSPFGLLQLWSTLWRVMEWQRPMRFWSQHQSFQRSRSMWMRLWACPSWALVRQVLPEWSHQLSLLNCWDLLHHPGNLPFTLTHQLVVLIWARAKPMLFMRFEADMRFCFVSLLILLYI